MRAGGVLDFCFELAMQFSLIGLCLTGGLVAVAERPPSR